MKLAPLLISFRNLLFQTIQVTWVLLQVNLFSNVSWRQLLLIKLDDFCGSRDVSWQIWGLIFFTLDSIFFTLDSLVIRRNKLILFSVNVNWKFNYFTLLFSVYDLSLILYSERDEGIQSSFINNGKIKCCPIDMLPTLALSLP